MWGKLGYPRRALRLKEAAEVITRDYGGEVPSGVDELLALPGLGDYTARAVAAFAFNKAVPVVDINVRRVLYRYKHGVFLTPTAKKRDLAEVAEWVDSAKMAVALMELGALVCVARTPRCDECSLKDECRWIALGRPEPSQEELKKKRVQRYEGTDRQVRGIIMDALKQGDQNREAINNLWEDQSQVSRALFGLLEDGLAVEDAGIYRLPD